MPTGSALITLLSFTNGAAGFCISAPRAQPPTRAKIVAVDSWYDSGKRLTAKAPSASPGLITQLAEGTVFDLWTELSKPFAAAAGVEYEESGPLKKTSAFERAEIDFDAFQGLLSSLGENIAEEKAAEMFAAVDKNADGKVDFVQCYKAVFDESRKRRPPGFLDRLFGGGGGA